MKFFKQMDLYKAVVLASVLLLPAAGWWIQKCRKAIEQSTEALSAATRTDGLLERIGKLLKQIETVDENNVGDSTNNVQVYFDNQVLSSSKSLKTTDFQIETEKQVSGWTGTKQQATDRVVAINFLKRDNQDFTLSRELLFAILYNCESGARADSGAAVTPIWKLRSLTMQNEAAKASAQAAPPAELPDRWIVRRLEFARREPGAKR